MKTPAGLDQRTPSYTIYRRRLVLGFALVLVMLVLALAWKLRASYLDDRHTAQAQTKSFVQAMAAHVASEVHSVDLALIGSVDALKALSSDEVPTPATIKALLSASGRAPDNHFWLLFIDADGKGVVASNGLAVAGVSYADRSHFAVHAKGGDVGLYVGEPVVSKVSRSRVFVLSRAVHSSTGRFLGVVAAPVDASGLAGDFRNALFAPGVSVTLAHADGKLIARSPLFEESFATDLTASPLFAHLQTAPSGTFEATSIIDGEDRVNSYRTLDGLPLIVSVGMASRSWTVGLVDDLLVAAVGLVVILAILLISGRLALDSYRRLDESELRLRLLYDDLYAARKRLGDSEERMRTVTDHLPALVSYIDGEQRYLFRNAAYAHVVGVDAVSMVGKTMREVHGEEDYRLVADEIARALRGETLVFERAMTLDGVLHHWQFAYTPDVVDERVVGVYAVVTDLSERMRVEHGLRSEARVDTLTGLPNRQQLYERLAEAIARCRRLSTLVACLYLDIDHFKEVNDALGHGAGDELLRQFGARLQAIVRQTDLVARISGDEFVVVSEGVETAADAAVVARKIIAAMQTPFRIAGEDRVVTASVGVVVSSGRDDDPESLLNLADSQLYVAKRRGKNTFELHDAAKDEAAS